MFGRIAAVGIAVAVAASLPARAQQQARPFTTDQTVQVSRGARLRVDLFAGEVVVRASDRDTVRVQARHSARERVDIRTTEAVVTVRAQASMGPPRSMDLEIAVPSWMRIDLNCTYTDVAVEGSQGEVTVETVRGDIRVKGGSGIVTAKSVEGMVIVDGAKGKINAHSVNEGLRLTDVSGDVTAETVNGDITIERAQAQNLDVATVNGDLIYDGTIRNDGQYRMTTHNGDITMAVPENTNATVSVRTFNGDFVPSFPLKLESTTTRRNRRFEFTLGNGRARIDLESFGGTIRLQRSPRAK